MDVEKILQRSLSQVNCNDNGRRKAVLDVLPDELLLLVLSYLDIVDIFQTFHQLNQRFVNLIYESARCTTLPQNTTNAWLQQYIPQLQYRIKIINLNDNYLKDVFTNQSFFPNLRLINLQGNGWHMSLRIEEKPASTVLISSLGFLRKFSFSTKEFFNNTQNNNIDVIDYNSENLLCPFLERLSIDVCNIQNTVRIQNYTPNLIYLKINRLTSNWYDFHLPSELNPIERMTRLVKLDIRTSELVVLGFLKPVINNCKTSLKNLVLVVNFLRPIDGYNIEVLLKPCEQLEKFVFLFKLHKKVDMDLCQRSFQSVWWFDAHRPPVYIQHNDDNTSTIVSMPCQFLFDFNNDLYNWYINKEDQYSSFVRFTNINKIHFTNKTHQLLNLQYLYFIDHVFTSSYQCLQVDCCDIESVDTSFELLMDNISMASILPNVNHLIIGSSDKFCALMLSVWILITSNLEKLDISKLCTFSKKIMAEELTKMIDNDGRLKPSFDHISELVLFSQQDYVNEKTKNELPLAFQKLFKNAVIY